MYPLNAGKASESPPEELDTERYIFLRLVLHGKAMSYPWYCDSWFLVTVKGLKEVES